ncbi:MAG: pantetheine-phosphate adenylyltransferase [Candidatus Aenigmatarchaeota archaeon]
MSFMIRAIYAGSFDPIHFGHLNIIERSTKLFDELIIGVGEDPRKKYLFTLDERIEFIEDALSYIDKNYVNKIFIEYFSGLLIEFAKAKNANVIIRGLRENTDFSREFQLGLTNMDIDNNIETIFLLATPEHLFISSSMLKEITMYGGDISKYVTKKVETALKEKFKKYKNKEKIPKGIFED